jgi:hypothetical protein
MRAQMLKGISVGKGLHLEMMEARNRASAEKARMSAAWAEIHRCDHVDELRCITLKDEEIQREDVERVRVWKLEIENLQRQLHEPDSIEAPGEYGRLKHLKHRNMQIRLQSLIVILIMENVIKSRLT